MTIEQDFGLLTEASKSRFGWNTIRFRLLVSFVVVALFVALAVSLSSIIMGFQSRQTQVINQLDAVVDFKEAEIDLWIQNLLQDLNFEQQYGQNIYRLRTLLQNPPTSPAFQEVYTVQNQQFRETVSLRATFDELFLMNRRGSIVIASNIALEGEFRGLQPYFREGLEGPGVYVQTLSFSGVTEGLNTVIVTQPVKDETGKTIGVLAGRAGLNMLSQIMEQRFGFGETGETYLVGANNVLLTPSRFPGFKVGQTSLQTEGLNLALQTKKNQEGLYDGYYDSPVFGVYHWLPDLQVILVAEQAQWEAFRSLYFTMAINLAVALLAALVAIGISLLITLSIAQPLDQLANVAGRISAGDLYVEVPVERYDEIGVLAQAFKQMTNLLRELIDSLEERVESRTRRLEIMASMSERLTSILNPQDLLRQLVKDVKDSFGYYHVHIYLFDEARQNLVMAEGTGEAGAKMKAQHHHIPVTTPNSLVIQAANTGQIVRVDNVRESENWLPNPLLPDTYAEMAVPIILDNQVVGVLDVQENMIAGLDDGDESLLRSLANQVAISIRNARLFDEVETRLAEARAYQERYVERAWDKDKVLQRGIGRAQFSSGESSTLAPEVVARVRQEIVRQRQPTSLSAPGETPMDVWGAPIMFNKTTIGNVQFHGLEPGHQWSEGELALIQAVIDQVAQSAESLRLVDEIQERAGRQKLISQIGDKLRRAPDIDSLMSIAVSEIANVLKPARTFVHLETGNGPERE